MTGTDHGTGTVRVWRGRIREGAAGDPDETHDLPLHDGHRYDAETVELSDSIRDLGWLAFDVVNLPDRVDVVRLNVHATDRYHNQNPLDEEPVERGLVFDGDYKPGEDPPCYKLHGRVECWLEPGGRS